MITNSFHNMYLRAPAKMTMEYLREGARIMGPAIPIDSIHGATVPGAAAAWVDIFEMFGSGKLGLTALFNQRLI